MNTYKKFCPNVYVAKCDEKHEKGEIIEVTTKHGNVNEHIVYNLVNEKDGFYYYSIVRADGYNTQERARRKAERYEQTAANADRRADQYYEKSQQHADFLSLGEPIKVGHHSERRHRKMIDDQWRNIGKMSEEMNKAEEYRQKAEGWLRHVDDINLSMPESLDYYKEKMLQAQQYHADMKSGKIERPHMYALTYAKKAANEAERNYELALQLWG